MININKEEIKEHIPVNRGQGTWEKVKIDFSTIYQSYQSISMK